MADCYLNSNFPSGSDFFKVFDSFSSSLDVFKNGYSVSESLVLDSEKGELVKAQPPVKSGKEGVSEEKAMAALKNHCEAERRRRERINSNLDTLRGLVPSSEKMDKATLLAEVISQVKLLKKTATEASKGTLIPTDSDEVTVEPYDNGAGNGTLSFRASLCCDYRPELLTELKQALEALQLNIVWAEMSTLEGRLKNVFIVTNKGRATTAEACKILVSSVHEALKSVVDKASYFSEYSPRTTLPSKRRRVLF
jgi:hypothetical protein